MTKPDLRQLKTKEIFELNNDLKDEAIRKLLIELNANIKRNAKKNKTIVVIYTEK